MRSSNSTFAYLRVHPSILLVSGLPDTWGIVADGRGHLFVSLYGTGTVAEYTTQGELVNGALVTGVTPTALALDDRSHLFVANQGSGTIGEYLTDGTPVNTSFISGFSAPEGMALDGQGHLFVSDFNSGTVGKYNLDGTAVNRAFITGLDGPTGLAFGPNGHLYVEDISNGTVLEYTDSGAQIDGSLISQLNSPMGIIVVPEPSTTALGTLALILLAVAGFRSGVGLNGERRTSASTELLLPAAVRSRQTSQTPDSWSVSIPGGGGW